MVVVVIRMIRGGVEVVRGWVGSGKGVGWEW